MTLQELRKERGLTQTEAANKVGTSQQSWQILEKNGVKSIDSAVQICKAFGLSAIIDVTTRSISFDRNVDSECDDDKWVYDLVYASLNDDGWKIYNQGEDIPDGCMETTFAIASIAGEDKLADAIEMKLRS